MATFGLRLALRFLGSHTQSQTNLNQCAAFLAETNYAITEATVAIPQLEFYQEFLTEGIDDPSS
jgi:hypothetical protein